MQNRSGSVARQPVRRRRKTSWIWRLSLSLFLVFVLAAGTGIGYMYFGSATVRQMVHDWHTGMWDHDQAFPGRDGITVMLLGRDIDLDNRAQRVDTNGRTDTILLAHFDFAANAANILSIPRDTLVRIPGYRGRRKINAAHAFGGPELVAATVDNFLGVRPDAYVVVDYDSFEKAVDQLGGLQVTVAKEMNYDDNWGNLHIHLKPGTQMLDGEEALGFVRYRKSNDGKADNDQDRIERQQQLLMATKRKMISASTFFKLPEVIDTIRGGVNSSMTDAQMMAIAKFVRNLPPEAIQSATLPGSTGRVYVTADEAAARELVSRMF